MGGVEQIAGGGLPVDDDQGLVAEVLRKDRKATAEFVTRCVDCVYPYVRRHLLPRADAVEDVMQEILLAAWQSLASFRGEAGLKSWFLGIAKHKLEDYYRKRLRIAEIQEEENSPPDTPVLPMIDEALDVRTQQKKVQSVLASLPEVYGLALLWRYRENKSLREMAKLTGKTEKAMERLLARARESFRRKWSDV